MLVGIGMRGLSQISFCVGNRVLHGHVAGLVGARAVCKRCVWARVQLHPVRANVWAAKVSCVSYNGPIRMYLLDLAQRNPYHLSGIKYSPTWARRKTLKRWLLPKKQTMGRAVRAVSRREGQSGREDMEALATVAGVGLN